LRRSFLTLEGEWDYAFTERHRERLADSLQRVNLSTSQRGVLTAEQGRIFWEVRAQTDDHMHVQGYAGTGKSFLVKFCLSLLQSAGAGILVLAERQVQLNALVGDLERTGQIHPKTFDKLADEIIPQDLTDPAFLRMRRTNYSRVHMPDAELARHLGIQAVDEFSPPRLAAAVRGTVRSFCSSANSEILSRHIPRQYASTFNALVTQVVLL
jgi:hypothetical protein